MQRWSLYAQPSSTQDECPQSLEPCFLPVEVVDRPVTADPAPAPIANATSGHNAIEINIAGGHQLRIIGGYDPEALARLIRDLSV